MKPTKSVYSWINVGLSAFAMTLTIFIRHLPFHKWALAMMCIIGVQLILTIIVLGMRDKE